MMLEFKTLECIEVGFLLAWSFEGRLKNTGFPCKISVRKSSYKIQRERNNNTWKEITGFTNYMICLRINNIRMLCNLFWRNHCKFILNNWILGLLHKKDKRSKTENTSWYFLNTVCIESTNKELSIEDIEYVCNIKKLTQFIFYFCPSDFQIWSFKQWYEQ